MIDQLHGRLWLVMLLAAVLNLAGCGRQDTNLASNQIGIRFPDRYLIKAEVVDTNAEREQGLSGRASLAEDAGMWFVFEEDGKHSIWMPDMNFAIDIVWVNSDFKVIEIAKGVSPEPGVPRSQLKRYVSQSPARYVLEISAGTAATHKLGAGDSLKLVSS
jgi:hypothetical protein